MISTMAGPTVRRLQLGVELLRLREAAGVSRPDAAAAIGCSEPRIGHIETGRNAPSKSDLIVLVERLYGADETTLAALEELREEASKRGWWSTYRLPKWLAGYVGLETDAISLRCLDIEIIPGLLQTEQYMRRLYTLSAPPPAKEIDRLVRARLQRQSRLTGPDALQLSAVVSQGALERCARDKAVADAQLAQLRERAAWPNVDLRVLPFDLGLHVGTGPFTVLAFPDHLLPDAAYQEYAVGGHIIDDPLVVARLATLFDELRGQSLDADESLAMIAQLASHTRE
ncbi:MAG: helix-turn-helix domain-containing protein [Pseudonocardiaceae bacterium]